jgi:uncharacterized protein (DUF1800 family)
MVRLTYRSQFFLFCLLGSTAFGQLDTDGNQVSDLWQRLYPEAVLDGLVDTDDDGMTDLDEGFAGTNPGDPESRLRISFDHPTVGVRYSTESGKWYLLEGRELSDGGVWGELGEPREGNGSEMLWELVDRSRGYVRIRVIDLDQDQDGLKSWEEFQFGLSDVNRYSNIAGSSGTGFTDYASASLALEGSGTGILANGKTFERRAQSREEVHKFLNQATWGATPVLTDELIQAGIAGWLHSQLTQVPQRSITLATNGNAITNSSTYPTLATMGGIRAIMNHEDQVSLKMTQALSEILVASTQNDTIRQNFPLQRTYYETLKRDSLGFYRDLLENITHSSMMGIYLSYIQNQKSDPETGRLPDENYAREIMQLFTIGLKKLNQDGTPVLDLEGNEIPTYDNEVIMEMAKIFTGFGFGGPSVVQFFSVPNGTQMHYPMIMYDGFHEPGEKQLFDNITIPAGQTGVQDVDSALDALCNHPNIAPFIGRLLIQRLVTSNPSPEYIARVAGVWDNDGLGRRGNLKAVARAILMDPEARGSAGLREDFGRVRGPFEQFIALMRALDAKNESTGEDEYPKYPVNLTLMVGTLQQVPLWAPSVFNFYLPNHSPVGLLQGADLKAPELQIMTDATSIAVDNFIRKVAENGIDVTSTYPADRIFLNTATALTLVDNPPALLDYLDETLLGGMMTDATRSAILNVLSRETIRDPEYLAEAAIHLAATSPEFLIQK